MKTQAIYLLSFCAFFLFLGVERCCDNSSKVAEMNPHFRGNAQPAVPVLSKYALFLSLATGVAGGILLAKSRAGAPTITPEQERKIAQALEKKARAAENSDPDAGPAKLKVEEVKFFPRSPKK